MKILLKNHVFACLYCHNAALRFVWALTWPRSSSERGAGGFSSSRKHLVTAPLGLENLHLAPVMLLAAPGPPILISLHPQGRRFIYAGSNSGVVQAPVAFCGKHSTCEDCVLARDPYCAWSLATATCVALYETSSPSRYLAGVV